MPPASSNYNNPDIGVAARTVLAHNGVETEVVYPRCCGMPQLERGDVARVAEHAQDRRSERCCPISRTATTSSRWCRPAR